MSMKSYRGHNGDVFAVAIFQDKLISAGYDRIIRIYDIQSCELLRKLAGHIDLIRSVDVYTADPKRPLIVSGSWDRTIRVWDMDTGACLQTLTGHTNRLKCVVVCDLTIPGVILSGSDDTTMRAWDIHTGHQIAEYNGHSHCVLSIAASIHTDPLAASGSTDCIICVWHLLSGKHMFNLTGHEAGVCALVFAKPPAYGSLPDLISSSSDSTIRVWSMQSGAQLHILQGHSFGVVALSLWQVATVPYPYLMTCAQNGTLQIWDFNTLELKKTTKTKTNYLISIAQKAGLDNMMAFCGAEGYIRVQRTEEIYNAADIVGSPVSPTKRSERVPNRASSKRRDNVSKRRNMPSVSRSISMESAGASFESYSFNDDDSLAGSFEGSMSPTDMSKIDLPEDETILHKLPNKGKRDKGSAQLAISDSYPATPRQDPPIETPKSPATNIVDEDIAEEEEELTVCSFEARVIQSVIREIVEKDMAPPSRGPSVEEEEGLKDVFVTNELISIVSNDDDVNSVMTEDDVSVFVNTTDLKRDNCYFTKGKISSSMDALQSRRSVNESRRLDGGGSITSLDYSIQAKAEQVDSVPRIPSAKWRHRGRHGPSKSITKGLGIGSRVSELRKVTTQARPRGLPRIIESAKPFILVTSVESATYTAMPPTVVKPHDRRNPSIRRNPKFPTVRHMSPPTIVSSPDISLPNLDHTSHNGYQRYNVDESLKTTEKGGGDDASVSSFFEVAVKPTSPIRVKRGKTGKRAPQK